MEKKLNGVFEFTETESKLILSQEDEEYFLFRADKIIFELIEISNINTPYEIIIRMTTKDTHGVVIQEPDIKLKKYGDKLRYIKDHYLLDAKSFSEFILDVRNKVFGIEIFENDNKTFKILMHYSISSKS